MASLTLYPLIESSRAERVQYVVVALSRFVLSLTAQPCTTRDLMNYLINVELAAENLQFFLWYRDYCKRFHEIAASEQALSPEWSAAQAEAANVAAQLQSNGHKLNKELFLKSSHAKARVFDRAQASPTPPRTPHADGVEEHADGRSGLSDDGSTIKASTHSFSIKAAHAFEAADVRWQPCEWPGRCTAKPDQTQSPSSPFERRCPASSSHILPKELLAS